MNIESERPAKMDKPHLQSTRILKNIFLKMLILTGNMTQNAIFAFTCTDIQLVRESIENDDQVDQQHHAIRNSLSSQFAGRTLTAQNITDILPVDGISYNTERIGDNPNKDKTLQAGSEG